MVELGRKVSVVHTANAPSETGTPPALQENTRPTRNDGADVDGDSGNRNESSNEGDAPQSGNTTRSSSTTTSLTVIRQSNTPLNETTPVRNESRQVQPEVC